jgi:hypothetical protein
LRDALARPRASLRAALPLILAGVLATSLFPAATAAHAIPNFDRFMAALGWVESGGRYDARNPDSGAYGKYQILPSNWPSWAEKYLGDRNAPQTPANQEKVARGKIHDLWHWLGSYRQVAYWWLTGRDGRNVSSWSSTAMTYVNKVMAYYYAKTTTSTTDRRVYNDGHASIRYSGRWDMAGHTGYVGGKAHYSTQRGATATLTFTGRTVAWYGPTGPTRGKARVSIDGTAVATIDLRSGSFVPREVLFSRRFPSTGKHTITITVLGTAGRPYVALDAFVVRG